MPRIRPGTASMARRLTIARPPEALNYQFARRADPSPKRSNCGQLVDAPEAAPWPRNPSGPRRRCERFKAFYGPVLLPPCYGHARGLNRAPNAAIRPHRAISRPLDIPRCAPPSLARGPELRPWRPGETRPGRAEPGGNRRKRPRPKVPPKREKPPRRRAAALRGPESRESRKVESRFAKVESRKSESRSRKSEIARKVAKVARFLKVGSRNKRRNAPQSRCKRF